jgi:hypothetical protein
MRRISPEGNRVSAIPSVKYHDALAVARDAAQIGRWLILRELAPDSPGLDPGPAAPAGPGAWCMLAEWLADNVRSLRAMQGSEKTACPFAAIAGHAAAPDMAARAMGLECRYVWPHEITAALPQVVPVLARWAAAAAATLFGTSERAGRFYLDLDPVPPFAQLVAVGVSDAAL